MSKFYPPKTHTAYREASVPKKGEILVDIDQDAFFLGDGVTPGGIRLSVGGGTASSEIAAGFNTEVIGGSTVGMKRFVAIESLVSGGTIFAGHSYKVVATSATTLKAESFDRGITGLDAKVEIMLNSTGYLHVAGNLTIKGALEPDAINNCVVRFHDGDAVLEVLDNVGGYIVTVASGSTAGTLVYALTNTGADSSPYITISSELNGTPLDLAGTTVTTERHVVGNGYEQTILGGTVSVGTSGTLTMAALGLNNTVVAAGTLTMGDVYIPNGATVSVSGGGLAVEKVSGDGGTIDLGDSTVFVERVASVAGCGITGGETATNGGALYLYQSASLLMSGCSVYGNHATSNGGAILATLGATVSLTSCTITGNSAGIYGGAIRVNNGGSAYVSGCVMSGNIDVAGNYDINTSGGTVTIAGGCAIQGVNLHSGVIQLAGSNSIGAVTAVGQAKIGSAVISSGAIVDLTGNSNPTPIAPGSGGVTFAPGGATVYPSAGQASAYMLGGMTVPTIGNTNVVNLNSTTLVLGAPYVGGTDAVISGCTVTNAASGGYGYSLKTIQFVSYLGGNLLLKDVVFSGNNGEIGVFVDGSTNTKVELVGCSYYDVNFALAIRTNARCLVSNCMFSDTNDVHAYLTANNGGEITCIGSTVGRLLALGSDGAAVFAGTNEIKGVIGEANGTVLISSGASINLTSSINPGGTVLISSGASININNNDYNAFGGITASSVNSSGYIGGATVSVPDGATCTYTYWSGGVSDTTSATGPATVVVPGDMSYCGN